MIVTEYSHYHGGVQEFKIKAAEKLFSAAFYSFFFIVYSTSLRDT